MGTKVGLASLLCTTSMGEIRHVRDSPMLNPYHAKFASVNGAYDCDNILSYIVVHRESLLFPIQAIAIHVACVWYNHKAILLIFLCNSINCTCGMQHKPLCSQDIIIGSTTILILDTFRSVNLM